MPFSRLTRRTLLATAGVAGAAAATGVFRTGFAWATAGPSHYDSTWASVDQHPAAPEWFQDAKFGIYYHWGTWSVPAFGSEWYPRNMWISGSAENQHHIATYGDLSVFPFHNFINGARDRAGNFVQFAPKLKSAGGNWDDANGLVIDSGGTVASGSRLKQWTWNGSTNLQWQFVPLGAGWYRIVNRTNGMVADSFGNAAYGASCLQAAWNGGNNQQWRLNDVGGGHFQIINRGTGTALDSAGNTTVGADTIMWAPNGSPNNHYTIVAV